ncbi:MAG: thiamine phosphate synthase [Lachnospiraceae bacterium]
MKQKMDYSLYLCTDRTLMSTDTLEEAVEQAIKGGCTLIQLREKDCSSGEFYQTAQSIKNITDLYHIPLIINDRVDLALAVGAAGVHVGQSDLPASIVRKIIGDDACIGVSVATVQEAVKAQEDGANYIGVGAMYATGTKLNTRNVSLELLKEIQKAVTIPIVVIGGIQKENAAIFKELGIAGLAVVSAIIAKPDIEDAARELKRIFKGE